MHEPERARARQLVRKGLLGNCESARLLTDQRMGKLDRYVQLEFLRRVGFVDRRPVDDPHRFDGVASKNSGSPSIAASPASASAIKNGAALPSSIGGSGPSMSIVTSSMPMPVTAAKTCSTV